MSLFVALKSSSPSLPLSISPSLLVLLLLSEQPNEAEGQWSARAILAHYARIHSLSHKQSGRQHWKTKQATLSLSTSAHLCRVFVDASYAAGKEKRKKIPERKNIPDGHVYVLESFASLLLVSDIQQALLAI